MENAPKFQSFLSRCLPVVLTLATVFLFASCGSTRLVPQNYSSQQNDYLYGSAEADGLFVTAEYIDVKANYMVYYVEIENDTDQVLDFDPTAISYIAHSAQPQTMTSYADRIYAWPEKKIEKVLTQRRNGMVALGALLFVTDVALNVSEVATQVNEDIYDSADLARSLARSASVSAASAGLEVASAVAFDASRKAKYDRGVARREVMRARTINPGEIYGGLVYLPTNKKESRIDLTVPVFANDFTFRFRKATRRELN